MRTPDARNPKGTYFAQTHLVCENAILAFTPKISEPVKTVELEVFELTSRSGEIRWVFRNLLKRWSLVLLVRGVLEREFGLRFPV